VEASGCRIITYGRWDAEFSIYDVSDIHYLNAGFLKSRLEKDLEIIDYDTYALFFEGGDYGDWIAINDPRFDREAVAQVLLSEIDPSLTVQDLLSGRTATNQFTILATLISKFMIRTFIARRRKCLGFLIGNHDWKYLTRHSELKVHEMICKTLRVPNMGFSGWCDLYFVYVKGFRGCRVVNTTVPPKKFTARLRCFIHHGMGAANTAGGKINKLKQLVDMVEADLVMMGHVHEQFAKAFLRLEPNHNCTEIGQKVTMGLITGSYLRTYAPGFTGYGEVAGYSPTTMGATRARYTPANMSLTVENRADNVGLKGNL